MSGNRIVVGHEQLARFIREVLVAKGASTADAASVADGLVWANLRGVDGHGVARLSSYLTLIERGEIDPMAQPRVLQDRGAILPTTSSARKSNMLCAVSAGNISTELADSI